MNNLFRRFILSFISSMFLASIFLSCDNSEDDTATNDDENEETLSYSFMIDDTKYELVALNKSWEDAAEYAVDMGGELAAINSFEEQKSIFTELIDNSNFNFSRTIADESGTAKVWIGGSDSGEEGKWIWDGNNDGSGTHFYQGDFFDGGAVDSRYTNWGSRREPDNFGATGQHALAIGITDWIFGSAGQWNDLRSTNLLYFLIEY